jgi:hypothetical protein
MPSWAQRSYNSRATGRPLPEWELSRTWFPRHHGPRACHQSRHACSSAPCSPRAQAGEGGAGSVRARYISSDGPIEVDQPTSRWWSVPYSFMTLARRRIVAHELIQHFSSNGHDPSSSSSDESS